MSWVIRISALALVLAGGVSGCALLVGDAADGSLPAPTDGSNDSGQSGAGGNADAGSDAAPSAPGCPNGRGPAMVAIDEHTCIDSTEVTNAQYGAFLNATFDAGFDPGWPSRCVSKAAFSSRRPGDSVPVISVDWCDAWAFCQWANKRLCGRINGGAADFDNYDNPFESEWSAACTSSGTLDYPYGSGEFVDGTCNATLGDPSCAPAPVASKPDCKTASGIFDLSGNVAEWENSCAIEDPDDGEKCHLRGSGCGPLTSTALACDGWWIREPLLAGASTGIRCCASR